MTRTRAAAMAAAEPPLTPSGAIRREVRLRRERISYLEWSAPGGRASRTAILLHGLQGTALTMARIAAGLSADGWRVVVPDLPGHGGSFSLDGWDADRPGPLDVSRLAILRHRLSRRNRLATSASVVAEMASSLEIAGPAVLGHSWGASIAATLPASGLHPSVIVLVDPPFVTAAQARTLGVRAIGPPASSYEEARDALLASRPDWHPLDLAAKADALATVSRRAMVGVVAANVPFDPLPALRRARQGSGVPVFVIVGEPDKGSLVSEAQQAGLRAVLGPDHVLVVPGAGHSPHRTHHDEFMTLVREILGAAAP